jgi:hypothetical protein
VLSSKLILLELGVRFIVQVRTMVSFRTMIMANVRVNAGVNFRARASFMLSTILGLRDRSISRDGVKARV